MRKVRGGEDTCGSMGGILTLGFLETDVRAWLMLYVRRMSGESRLHNRAKLTDEKLFYVFGA